MHACLLAVRWLIGLLAAVVATMAAAQISPAPEKPISVKTGVVGALSDAGIYIALDMGFFKEEGLDVDLVEFRVGPQIIPSLATGQVQASGLSVSPSMFNALQVGSELRLVADKGQVSRGFGWAAITVRGDLAGAIRDFKDLKGRKIGMPSKGASLFTQLGKALEAGGLGPNDVDLVEIGFPEMMTALANKAIDAAILIEPFVTLVVQRQVAVRWKGVEDFFPFKAQNGLVAYSEHFIKEQPDAARRWMTAHLRGVRVYADSIADPSKAEAVYRILAGHTAVKDLSLYPKMQPIDFDANGRFEVRSLELDQDWFLKLGSQQQRADLSKVIDYRYVDAAAADLAKRRQ
jgi:NitT/TauT family transport system substrate-binding protein